LCWFAHEKPYVPYKTMVEKMVELTSSSSNVYGDVSRFFDLLKDFYEPLKDGCTNHSKLLIVALVFIIKLDYGLSKAG